MQFRDLVPNVTHFKGLNEYISAVHQWMHEGNVALHSQWIKHSDARVTPATSFVPPPSSSSGRSFTFFPKNYFHFVTGNQMSLRRIIAQMRCQRSIVL